METIFNVYRGGNTSDPIITPKGDRYDSTGLLMLKDGQTKEFKHINTDYSVTVGRGGILSEGDYGAVVGLRNTGLKAAWLFDLKYWDNVFTRKDITPEMAMLPSLCANPNHNDLFFVQWIMIHKGGFQSDFSAACITLYPDEYESFFKWFSIGDKFKVHMERAAWGSQAWPRG